MADNSFPQGIRVFKPNAKAPVYVIADITINKEDLIQWLMDQPDEVRLTIKESQKGSYYAAVNTFERTQGSGNQAQSNQTKPAQKNENLSDDSSSDLPF